MNGPQKKLQLISITIPFSCEGQKNIVNAISFKEIYSKMTFSKDHTWVSVNVKLKKQLDEKTFLFDSNLSSNVTSDDFIIVFTMILEAKLVSQAKWSSEEAQKYLNANKLIVSSPLLHAATEHVLAASRGITGMPMMIDYEEIFSNQQKKSANSN